MSRGRLVVHGHFYQPLRVDPFSGTVPADPSAAPFENWNARVAAECYRPNAERRNYGQHDEIVRSLGMPHHEIRERIAECDAKRRHRDAEQNRIAEIFQII